MKLGNCDIDFFVFCHRFYIMIPKLPIFERLQNVAKNLNSVNVKAWNYEIGQNYH
jgi:hypothetical protein